MSLPPGSSNPGYLPPHASGTNHRSPSDSQSQQEGAQGMSNTMHDGKQTLVVASPLVPRKSASSLDIELGLKQVGPYHIGKVLGFGAMATVYQAEDSQLNRHVALKVLNKKWLHDPVAKERFLREAKLASLIKSKHVVLIHAVGEDKGVPYLAMELLEGFPLDRILNEKINLTVTQILRLGREIARGLAAAHEKGLVHRDIKPANIWLETVTDERGGDKKLYRVKLLDFGMARLQEQSQGLTRHGMVVGTPFYMSPEQASSGKVDGRSDLFSLGVVLYQLCTGSLPFQGETAVSVMSALITQAHLPVQDLNPDIPKKLSRLIDRLLAKIPLERPASALITAKLLENLEREVNSATPVVESASQTGLRSPVFAPHAASRLQTWLIVSVIFNVVLLALVAFLAGRLLPELFPVFPNSPQSTKTAGP
jgi:serine/threonine protein kinase